MSAPFDPTAEPDTAAAARAMHARRALERALDHGTDLLAALGMPSHILDALEAGIDALDALDESEEDLEPWLAGDYSTGLHSQRTANVTHSPTYNVNVSDAKLGLAAAKQQGDRGAADLVRNTVSMIS